MSKTRRDPSSSSSQQNVHYVASRPPNEPPLKQQNKPSYGAKCVICGTLAHTRCWCGNHFCNHHHIEHQEENKAHLWSWHYTPTHNEPKEAAADG